MLNYFGNEWTNERIKSVYLQFYRYKTDNKKIKTWTQLTGRIYHSDI
jgi:hypothetical protein